MFRTEIVLKSYFNLFFILLLKNKLKDKTPYETEQHLHSFLLRHY